MDYKQFYTMQKVDDAIMQLLHRRPMTTKQIAKQLHIARQTASLHLNRLVNADKLEKHKKGAVAFFGVKFSG